MAGAKATAGSDGGDVVAQPLTSVSSGISISAGTRQVLFDFINDPLQRFGAPTFFGPGVLFGLPGGPFKPGKLFGVRGASGGVIRPFG
jgi:hypothetical protein